MAIRARAGTAPLRGGEQGEFAACETQAAGEAGVEFRAGDTGEVVAHDAALGQRFVAGHGKAAAQFGESDEQQAQAVFGVQFVIGQQPEGLR